MNKQDESFFVNAHADTGSEDYSARMWRFDNAANVDMASNSIYFTEKRPDITYADCMRASNKKFAAITVGCKWLV